MKEYEYLFSTNLHAKLKEKIVGKIFVKVTYNDELLIKINSYGNLECTIHIGNFSERILNGWSTDYAVYEVIKQYREFLNKKFFY